MDYEDLVRYEHENTALDFKRSQYTKKTHQDLLKDVISMANADVEETRHIVIGISHSASLDFHGAELG